MLPSSNSVREAQVDVVVLFNAWFKPLILHGLGEQLVSKALVLAENYSDIITLQPKTFKTVPDDNNISLLVGHTSHFLDDCEFPPILNIMRSDWLIQLSFFELGQ